MAYTRDLGRQGLGEGHRQMTARPVKPRQPWGRVFYHKDSLHPPGSFRCLSCRGENVQKIILQLKEGKIGLSSSKLNYQTQLRRPPLAPTANPPAPISEPSFPLGHLGTASYPARTTLGPAPPKLLSWDCFVGQFCPRLAACLMDQCLTLGNRSFQLGIWARPASTT